MEPDSELRGFSPNDFFWVSASAEMAGLDCAAAATAVVDADCAAVTSGDPTTAKACYDHELCKNKQYAEWLAGAQMAHTGAGARYADSRVAHNAQVLTALNLGAGIAGLVALLYAVR